jgi:DNA-binding CsgD family transcriptional regulator
VHYLCALHVHTQFDVFPEGPRGPGGGLERLTQRDLRALGACVAEIYAHLDLDTFREHVVRAISKVVPAEVITYTEIGNRGQPTTRSLHPARPIASDLMLAFERHRHEHPLIKHFSGNPHARAAKISDFLTQRAFHRLGLYDEFFRQVGVEHQMVIGLPAPSPRVVGVALNRSGLDFSERDRLLLSALRPHIVQAFGNAESFSQIKREMTLVLQGLEEIGRGIVLLGPDGGIRSATRLARQWLTAYFGHRAVRAKHLPEALQRWVRFQGTTVSSSDDVFSVREPLVVEGQESRLVVRLIPASGGGLLLLEQRHAAQSPASFESLGLSRREAEVLAWVAQGKTDAAIGTILSLSPRTVAKHLEHIYQRLGVENRSAAVALALTAPLATS